MVGALSKQCVWKLVSASNISSKLSVASQLCLQNLSHLSENSHTDLAGNYNLSNVVIFKSCLLFLK